ncbi:MAG: thioredoxin family protein [Candidatus Thorarchaeota archaeon]|nr:thioredoxin family protein [Candidatus Thorarchaeota archaeon]
MQNQDLIEMVVEMDDATKEQVIELFSGIVNDVTVHLFLEEINCLYCNDTKDMVEQLAELSDRINIVEHKGSIDSDDAKEMGIERHPAIVLHGKEKYNVKFYGIPAGHEFGALVGSIIDVSTGTAPLPLDVIEDIISIDKPINIKVFVTPQCPYCPEMTRLAHQASILNPMISSEMIESLEFQEMTAKYGVFGVPKTIINETTIIDGLSPVEMFVEKLFESIDN